MSVRKPKPPIKTELTVKEMLELLTDYSVIHEQELPTVTGGYYGLTDPKNKKIFIADNVTVADRRKALIHEFLHAYHIEKEDGASHRQVYKEEKLIYEAIFGERINDSTKADRTGKGIQRSS